MGVRNYVMLQGWQPPSHVMVEIMGHCCEHDWERVKEGDSFFRDLIILQAQMVLKPPTLF